MYQSCFNHFFFFFSFLPLFFFFLSCSSSYDRGQYLEMVAPLPPHRDLIVHYIKVQAIVLSPICPHICEHIWDLLGNKTSIMQAQWPEVIIEQRGKKEEEEEKGNKQKDEEKERKKKKKN